MNQNLLHYLCQHIISQALHETLGDDILLVSAENSLPMLETVKDASDVVQSGRTIKGDPLKVQYTMSCYVNELCFSAKLLIDYYKYYIILFTEN